MAVLSRLANLVLRQIVSAATPPAGSNVIYPKADGRLYIKGSDGVEHCIGVADYSTGAPANPVTGELWYDSDDPGPTSIGAMPTGVITPVGGDTAPPGSLLCDGTTFSSVTYPALANYLQDTHGAHTGTDYYLPNMTGRMPVGVDPGDPASWADFSVVGRKGGSKLLHQHNHSGDDHIHLSPDHGHTVSGTNNFMRYVGSGGNVNTGFGGNNSQQGQSVSLGGGAAWTGWKNPNGNDGNTGLTGSGTSQNVPPYIVLKFVIWT